MDSTSSGSNSSSVDTDYYFKIYSVGSASIKEGSDTEVVIKGEGFSHITKVELNNDYEIDYKIIDNEEAIIILPADIDEGIYDVELRGEGGRTAIMEKAITVIKGRNGTY